MHYFQNAPGAHVIKLFLSVIYEFLYKVRVFVRLGWKSLLMTNTGLFQKLVIYGQKSFITLGPGDFATAVSYGCKIFYEIDTCDPVDIFLRLEVRRRRTW